MKLQKEKIGIDVGACIGESLYQFNGYTKVYAIEPGPEEFSKLASVAGDHVICIEGAVGLKNEDVEFITYWNGRFSSFLEFNKDEDFYKHCEETTGSFDDFKEKITVKSFRLDTFINENNIKEIEYIKIDTQGTDLDVVKSLGDKISIVKKILLEVQLKELYKGASKKKEVLSYMSDNNFSLVENNDHHENEYEQDLLFINNNFI